MPINMKHTRHEVVAVYWEAKKKAIAEFAGDKIPLTDAIDKVRHSGTALNEKTWAWLNIAWPSKKDFTSDNRTLTIDESVPDGKIAFDLVWKEEKK